MTVGGKGIFSFNSAGYPGDIVFSYDDLTVEHPEFLKLDGGSYKKEAYPQIEKFFNYGGVTPYKEAINLAEFNETKTSKVPLRWRFSQDGDNIAIAYLHDYKETSNDRMYIKLYLSKDRGATFTKISDTYFSGYETSGSYAKTLIRYKDKTMLFYKSAYNSNSGPIYCHCIKDGETSWTKSTAVGTHDTSTMKVVTYSNYVFIYGYQQSLSSGQREFVNYADITQKTLTWKKLDAGDIYKGEIFLCKVPNIDKLIYGTVIGSNTEKFRVYEPDLTYTEYSAVPYSTFMPDVGSLGTYTTDMIFYHNGEYVMLAGGSSYGYYVLKTKDFINWTGYVREAPKYGIETASYVYYLGKTDKELLFKSNKQNEANGNQVMARNSNNYSKEGDVGLFSSGLTDFSQMGISEVMKDADGYYIISAIYKYDDTTSTCYVQKRYLRDVVDWFKLPMAKTLTASLGASSNQYPYIRTE